MDEFQKKQKDDTGLQKHWQAAETARVSTRAKENKICFLVKAGLLYREFQSTKIEESKPIPQGVMPAAFRDGLMVFAHESIMAGHLKTQKTLDGLMSSFCWPGMADSVRHYCISCDICQRTVQKGSQSRATGECSTHSHALQASRNQFHWAPTPIDGPWKS